MANPAIAIAVVIDTPTAGGEAMHYGGAASAPVFAEVAQEVLQYLGVPRDQPLKTPKQMMLAKAEAPHEEVSDADAGDLAAMFDEVNSLPADDPLRHPATAAAMAANQSADQAYDAAAAAKKAPSRRRVELVAAGGVEGVPCGGEYDVGDAGCGGGVEPEA